MVVEKELKRTDITMRAEEDIVHSTQQREEVADTSLLQLWVHKQESVDPTMTR